MGRKTATTSKGKLKRLKRKEETDRLAAVKSIVDAANALEDPLAPLAPFKKFERNGLSLEIQCNRVTNMDTADFEWAYNITEKNMKTLYEQSDWGWDGKQKREEMSEEAAWYLMARKTSDRTPVGMVHFRFDLDEGDEVLYCYEIQLSKEVRRKGLGKFLMQILELMAHKTHMKKLMVTAFKHNPDAQAFFKDKLRFTVDETSPEETMAEAMFSEEGEGYTYEILSKTIGVKKAAKTENGSAHTNTKAVSAS